MPHHEEAFVPAFLFQPTAIYDTPWKTFPVYHGTNLHELVLGEEEEQDKEKEKHSNAREGALSSALPPTNPQFRRCYVRVRARFVRLDDLAQDVFPPSFPSLSFLKSSPILSLSIFQTM